MYIFPGNIPDTFPVNAEEKTGLHNTKSNDRTKYAVSLQINSKCIVICHKKERLFFVSFLGIQVKNITSSGGDFS